MLSEKEIEALLSKLCVRLGFCLPPEECRRLQENPPEDIKTFTDAVFVAEGLNPEYARRDLYRQVKTLITEAFDKHDKADFNDCLLQQNDD